ncbi:hypothetical protein SUGI_1098410 [Cryptomeria japonica]|nr:hypothetical protein SUGI_1098410 [Cryptomeria japonica]
MKRAAKEKANVVGIFGMGGVGKTTLAKELFNQNRSKYRRASFLFDVREAYANDDIDHVEQLDALLVMDILNKPGNNLVIITTRDVGVLVSAGIDIGYHLKGLDREDGRDLFCWHAFNQPLPVSGHEDLVKDFVNMCGGLPLSLQVLSRHVSGRDQYYWQEVLKKVCKTLHTVHRDINQRLKISFDTLDDVEKQIFMDIACFFIDKSVTKAMIIWKGSGWNAHYALETLKEKCLVEEVEIRYLNRLEWKWEYSSDGSILRMHDHLRDLGREMALELGSPHRLWRPQDLKSFESKGFQTILAQTKGRCFHSILDKSMGCKITYFLGEPEDGSEISLLWLQLEYLNLPQSLQCLRISNGRFRRSWQSDVQAPSHSKELQIHDTFLEEFPDLSGKLNNMEKLVLHAKDMQMDVWSLLGSLRMNLRSLNVMGSELTGDLTSKDTTEDTLFKSLVIYEFQQLWSGELALNNKGWSRLVMNGIENLEIKGQKHVTKILINGNCCQRLQSFKICEMENLIEVDLSMIKTLNCFEITDCKHLKRLSAVPDLTNLLAFKVHECPELEELSCCDVNISGKMTIKRKSVAEISNLGKLTELNMSGCLQIRELRLAHLSSLEMLTIQNCKLLRIVSMISDLRKLVELNIGMCIELQELCFGHSNSPERITIKDCETFKRLSATTDLTKLVDLKIEGCTELLELCFVHLSFLERITIKKSIEDCPILERVSGIPDLRRLTGLYIKECPEIKELPSIARLSCLEQIEIDSCEKLQNITLLSRLIRFTMHCCRELQSVGGTSDVTDLVLFNISQCLELEELSFGDQNCLERITIKDCKHLKCVSGISNLAKLVELEISDCGKLEFEYLYLNGMKCLERIIFDRNVSVKYVGLDGCQNLKKIMLSCEELVELSIQGCPELEELPTFRGNFELRHLYIADCPELEGFPDLGRLNCLEFLNIWNCKKLESVTLPTTLINLSLICCRELQTVAGIGNLANLTELVIKQCPELKEIPSLDKLLCLKIFVIDRCAKLGNISVIEIGGNGEIGSHKNDVREMRAILGCFVIVVDSSTWVADINENLCIYKGSGITVREGEWIITMVACDYLSYRYYMRIAHVLSRYGIMKKGYSVEVKKDEQWKTVGMLHTIVNRLHRL